MAAGLDPAGADAGLGVRPVGEQALAILEEGAAFVRQGDAPRRAHQELDAQAPLERIDAPADDRRRDALELRGRGQAAAGRDRGE